MSSPTQEPSRVTRTDVANDAGVSTAVVSYVVNGGPRNVTESTRLKVEASISRLGYRPNPVARALKLGKTATLGLLLPDITDSYFAELANAIEESASRRGFALILASSSNDSARERDQYSALHDRQVDGMIVAPTEAEVRFLDSVGTNAPTVLIDRASPRPEVASMGINNYQGAFVATEHLIQQHGYQRIACLSGPEGVSFAQERERGWSDAVHRGGATGEIVRSRFSKNDAFQVAVELLARPERPEAVLALSGVQGVGVLRACWELGLRVPEDVAVIAFDGTEASAFTTPPLSVVQHDLTSTAELAVDLVLRARVDQDVIAHEIVPFELIRRASCGQHRGDAATAVVNQTTA